MDVREAGTKVDVHARITDEIIRAIEMGVESCEMPWHGRAGTGFPRNPVTGNPYRSVNVVRLWATSRLRGYGLPYWATYRQWRSVGAQVRHGEHGSPVVFYKRIDEDDSNQDEHNHGSRVLLRYSSVFNAEQVEGWSPTPQSDSSAVWVHELVDPFVNGIGADIRYGSDSAYYSPKFDRIYMPDKSDFVDTKSGSAVENFYAVLLHELIHWSGHESRLNRGLALHYGSHAYAMEELIAELGAAFLCASLNISTHPRPDHATYIASWLTVLRQQKSAIFVAATSAALACRYVLDEYTKKNPVLEVAP